MSKKKEQTNKNRSNNNINTSNNTFTKCFIKIGDYQALHNIVEADSFEDLLKTSDPISKKQFTHNRYRVTKFPPLDDTIDDIPNHALDRFQKGTIANSLIVRSKLYLQKWCNTINDSDMTKVDDDKNNSLKKNETESFPVPGPSGITNNSNCLISQTVVSKYSNSADEIFVRDTKIQVPKNENNKLPNESNVTKTPIKRTRKNYANQSTKVWSLRSKSKKQEAKNQQTVQDKIKDNNNREKITTVKKDMSKVLSDLDCNNSTIFKTYKRFKKINKKSNFVLYNTMKKKKDKRKKMYRGHPFCLTVNKKNNFHYSLDKCRQYSLNKNCKWKSVLKDLEFDSLKSNLILSSRESNYSNMMSNIPIKEFLNNLDMEEEVKCFEENCDLQPAGTSSNEMMLTDNTEGGKISEKSGSNTLDYPNSDFSNDSDKLDTTGQIRITEINEAVGDTNLENSEYATNVIFEGIVDEDLEQQQAEIESNIESKFSNSSNMEKEKSKKLIQYTEHEEKDCNKNFSECAIEFSKKQIVEEKKFSESDDINSIKSQSFFDVINEEDYRHLKTCEKSSEEFSDNDAAIIIQNLIKLDHNYCLSKATKHNKRSIMSNKLTTNIKKTTEKNLIGLPQEIIQDTTGFQSHIENNFQITNTLQEIVGLDLIENSNLQRQLELDDISNKKNSLETTNNEKDLLEKKDCTITNNNDANGKKKRKCSEKPDTSSSKRSKRLFKSSIGNCSEKRKTDIQEDTFFHALNLRLKDDNNLSNNSGEVSQLPKNTSDTYTGTLKATIKINRDSENGEKAIIYKIGNIDDHSNQEETKKIANKRNNSETETRPTLRRDTVSNSNAVNESTDKSTTSNVTQRKLYRKDDLVIPEKISKRINHPSRVCYDTCNYCFVPFGTFDTPRHLASIKNLEKRLSIEKYETPIKLDTCLCDDCFRLIEKRNPRKENQENFTNNNCCFLNCTNVGENKFKEKWVQSWKEILKNKEFSKDIIVSNKSRGNNNVDFVGVCNEHVIILNHYSTCQLCRKRLGSHVSSLSNKVEELNSVLTKDGMSFKLIDDLYCCKACLDYCDIRKKYLNKGKIPRRHLQFLSTHRQKICRALNIPVPDGKDDQLQNIVRPIQIKKEVEDTPPEINQRNNPQVESTDNDEGVRTLNGLANLLDKPDNQTMIKVQFGNVNIRRLNNLNIGQSMSAGSSRNTNEGSSNSINLDANFEFHGVQSTDGSWEKVVSTLQFDRKTKKLWQDYQSPFGNQSSFVRHLLKLYHFWYTGSLKLSETADESTSRYLNSVLNRLRAFDIKGHKLPSNISCNVNKFSSSYINMSTSSEKVQKPIKEKFPTSIQENLDLHIPMQNKNCTNNFLQNINTNEIELIELSNQSSDVNSSYATSNQLEIGKIYNLSDGKAKILNYSQYNGDKVSALKKNDASIDQVRVTQNFIDSNSNQLKMLLSQSNELKKSNKIQQQNKP